jgi:hypothetical protein
MVFFISSSVTWAVSAGSPNLDLGRVYSFDKRYSFHSELFSFNHRRRFLLLSSFGGRGDRAVKVMDC